MKKLILHERICELVTMSYELSTSISIGRVGVCQMGEQDEGNLRRGLEDYLDCGYMQQSHGESLRLETGEIRRQSALHLEMRRARNANHRMFRVRGCYSKSSADSRHAMRREANGFLRYKGVSMCCTSDTEISDAGFNDASFFADGPFPRVYFLR